MIGRLQLGQRQRGFAVVEWTVGIGMLMLPMAILVVSFAPWFERASMASVIAQESARAVVLGDDYADGVADAELVAREIANNYGFGLDAWCLAPGPDCLSVDFESSTPGLLGRGAEVTATVEVPIPGVVVPFIGDLAEFQWSTDHVERVDDYRSFP